MGSGDETNITRPHTKISTETFLATDETEKYTDVRIILAQLSGMAAAGTENRMDKVHTLQLEGYRKFDFMLLRAHAAQSGECSYNVDARRYYHARVMRDFTPFFNLQTILTIIFSPSVRSSIVHSRNSYLVYRQLCPEIISHKVSTPKIQSCLILGKTKRVTAL